MDNENNLVKVEGENGETFDMLILKEFEYKNKRYAVLSELDYCKCEDDEYDCEEHDCNCGCDEHECSCEDEPMLCLLEITKDKEGNEVFKSIDDEDLFNELVEKADEVLYED